MNKYMILIKYGELTTKKNNRKMFITILKHNILDKLSNLEFKLTYDRSRMFIENFNNDDLDEILLKLKDIFGIHGIVVCKKVNNNIDDINLLALNSIKNFKTFKVKTKRSNKKFFTSSNEVNNIIGAYILKNKTNISVDVHNPEVIINVEIREDFTYVYSETILGSGGYPVSSLGKGLLMLSGGIDSPVAGYLTMKRGVKIECIYFASPPHTSIQANNKVKNLVKILTKYQSSIKLHIIPFTKIQEEIYKNCDNDYIITLMRRMMYRISEKLAHRNKLKILINGESLGQVASQTLSSISVINEVISTPVIRPVATLDKLEIIEISKKIETYETSILPYEDCCTIFVPKHPVINPNRDKCINSEKLYDWDILLKEVMSNIETITIKNIDDLNNLL